MSSTTPCKLNIHPSWKPFVLPELEQPYMQQLRQFLMTEKQAGYTIYPPSNLVFNALRQTPLPDVKVLLLGLI